MFLKFTIIKKIVLKKIVFIAICKVTNDLFKKKKNLIFKALNY